MDRSKSHQQTSGHSHNPRESIPVCRELYRPRVVDHHEHNSNHKHRKRHRNYVSIFTIALLLNPLKVLAQTSQTAAPVANSSGSVTNMAIQSLQGNLIQNQYGGNIVCQGPMLTFSPFLTDSHTYSTPREFWYSQPQYNDDGEITHYTQNRTGQKDNFALNLGFSMTFSIPLDNSLQRRCKESVDTQISRQKQLLQDSQLNWHIARLKNCGELKLKGIEFAPWSPYAELCKDVVVRAKMGQVLPHRHKTPTSSFSLKPLQRGLIPSDGASSLSLKELQFFVPESSLFSLPPEKQGASQSSKGEESKQPQP